PYPNSTLPKVSCSKLPVYSWTPPYRLGLELCRLKPCFRSFFPLLAQAPAPRFHEMEPQFRSNRVCTQDRRTAGDSIPRRCHQYVLWENPEISADLPLPHPSQGSLESVRRLWRTAAHP